MYVPILFQVYRHRLGYVSVLEKLIEGGYPDPRFLASRYF